MGGHRVGRGLGGAQTRIPHDAVQQRAEQKKQGRGRALSAHARVQGWWRWQQWRLAVPLPSNIRSTPAPRVKAHLGFILLSHIAPAGTCPQSCLPPTPKAQDEAQTGHILSPFLCNPGAIPPSGSCSESPQNSSQQSPSELLHPRNGAAGRVQAAACCLHQLEPPWASRAPPCSLYL